MTRQKISLLSLLIGLLLTAAIILVVYQHYNGSQPTSDSTEQSSSSETETPADPSEDTSVDSDDKDGSDDEVDSDAAEDGLSEPTPEVPSKSSPPEPSSGLVNVPEPPKTPNILNSLILIQQGSEVIISGDNLAAAEKSYHTTSSDEAPDCSTASDWQSLQTENISGLQDEDWICVRAVFADGDVKFAKLQINLSIPLIILEQEGSTLSVGFEPANVLQAHFFTSTEAPDCSSKNEVAVWSELLNSRIENLSDDLYVCLRASLNDRIAAYKEFQVDLAPPNFQFNQKERNLSIEVDPDIVASFNYFQTFNVNPNCNSENEDAPWRVLKATQFEDINPGDWFCLHLVNHHGVSNFKDYHVIRVSPPDADRHRPTLRASLVQHGTTAIKLNIGSLAAGTQVTSQKHLVTSTQPNCRSQSLASTYTDLSNQQITSFSVNDWVCVKLRYLNRWYFLMIQVKPPASISVHQRGTTVIRPTFEAGSSKRAYAIVSGSGDCYTPGDQPTWVSAPAQITTTAGAFVCLRSYKSGVYSYLNYELTQSPTVASFATSRGVIDITWPASTSKKYFTSSSDPNCSPTYTGSWTTTTTSSTRLSNQSNGIYVCTELTESSTQTVTVSGYAEHRLSIPPTITFTQHGTTAVAVNIVPANSTNKEYWYLNIPPINPTCTANSALWANLDTSTPITGLGSNAYVCVRATDSPATGYTGYSLQTPSVATLDTDTAGQITVTWPTATGISAKRYFTSATDPTCDQTATGWTTATGATTALTSLTNGTYICTASTLDIASSSNKVIGYAKGRLAILPTITLAQNKTTLTITFSPTTVTNKRYFSQSGDPACDGTDTGVTWTNIAGNGQITGLTHNHYLCIQATDGTVDNYLEHRFSTAKPNGATIKRSSTNLDNNTNNSLSNASPADWTHKFHLSAGSNVIERKYFKASSNPDCSDNNTSATWTTFTDGTLNVEFAESDYICTRIKDNRQYYGYSEASPHSGLAYPDIYYSNTSQAYRVAFRSGSIQSGSKRYFKGSGTTEPECGPEDDHRFSSLPTSFSLSEGQWVCVRVTNNSGKGHSYGKAQRPTS